MLLSLEDHSSNHCTKTLIQMMKILANSMLSTASSSEHRSEQNIASPTHTCTIHYLGVSSFHGIRIPKSSMSGPMTRIYQPSTSTQSSIPFPQDLSHLRTSQ